MRAGVRSSGFGFVVAAALGVAALASLAPASPAVSSCAGAGPNHVALVIEHGDASVVTRCVAFDTTQITGKQLLEASGLAWSGQTFGGFGVAACAIDGEPAHYSTCPGKDSYWAIFVSRGGGAWQFASSGISALNLSSGDAEGFRYLPATGTPAAPPAPAGVCTTAIGPTPAPPAQSPAGAGTATAPTSAGRTATAAAATGRTAGATDLVAAAASPAPADASSTAPAAGDSPAASSARDAAIAAVASPASTAAASPGAAPAPARGGGLDLGLLLAAIVGGALGGLALLRLAVARRERGT
jgi:hypothetical protein